MDAEETRIIIIATLTRGVEGWAILVSFFSVIFFDVQRAAALAKRHTEPA